MPEHAAPGVFLCEERAVRGWVFIVKSTLIKDTTKEERIALIKEWIPDDDGLLDCEIDLWDMYRDYIDGKREIAEINADFQTDFQAGF